jgi:hypothetical protein
MVTDAAVWIKIRITEILSSVLIYPYLHIVVYMSICPYMSSIRFLDDPLDSELSANIFAVKVLTGYWGVITESALNFFSGGGGWRPSIAKDPCWKAGERLYNNFHLCDYAIKLFTFVELVDGLNLGMTFLSQMCCVENSFFAWESTSRMLLPVNTYCL